MTPGGQGDVGLNLFCKVNVTMINATSCHYYKEAVPEASAVHGVLVIQFKVTPGKGCTGSRLHRVNNLAKTLEENTLKLIQWHNGIS